MRCPMDNWRAVSLYRRPCFHTACRPRLALYFLGAAQELPRDYCVCYFMQITHRPKEKGGGISSVIEGLKMYEKYDKDVAKALSSSPFMQSAGNKS